MDQYNSTAIEDVQQAFLKEVQEKGIEHVLEHISIWYTKTANARIEQYYEIDSPLKEDAMALELIRLATQNTSKSTGAGHNMMTEARIEALAKRVQRSHVNRAIEQRMQKHFEDQEQHATRPERPSSRG